ncbi:MAG: outer membrane beta-barrel protein [Deltaproteobacteria bacterium]|jgi:hypothetical protein|nr:outer membrane beta-barrel protein [Deltaproteobacteria bacterium]
MRLAFALPLCALLPAAALAAGQGETALSGGPGLAVLFDGRTRAGVTADARLLYGLSDAWSARLGLQAVWMPPSDRTSASYLTVPTLGLAVAADATNLVPFAEAGMAFVDQRGGGTSSRQRLGGHLGAGADYLVSRHFTLSALARIDYYPLRLTGGHETSPTLLTFAIHLGRVF